MELLLMERADVECKEINGPVALWKGGGPPRLDGAARRGAEGPGVHGGAAAETSGGRGGEG